MTILLSSIHKLAKEFAASSPPVPDPNTRWIGRSFCRLGRFRRRINTLSRGSGGDVESSLHNYGEIRRQYLKTKKRGLIRSPSKSAKSEPLGLANGPLVLPRKIAKKRPVRRRESFSGARRDSRSEEIRLLPYGSLARTRRLLLAALRVWELKNGTRDPFTGGFRPFRLSVGARELAPEESP